MMRRKKISDDFKRFILFTNHQEFILKKRKRSLYNRFFSKSLFYIGTLVVRLLYLFLFVVVFCMYNKPHSIRNERYEQCESEHFHSGKKGSTDIVHLKTNFDEYRISKDFHDCIRFKQGDIIKVELNLFGKPIHFTQDGWDMKYGIYKNYIYYYMLLFATCLTFFFNDGLDPFTNKLLYIFYAVDVVSIVLFFIT